MEERKRRFLLFFLAGEGYKAGVLSLCALDSNSKGFDSDTYELKILIFIFFSASLIKCLIGFKIKMIGIRYNATTIYFLMSS